LVAQGCPSVILKPNYDGGWGAHYQLSQAENLTHAQTSEKDNSLIKLYIRHGHSAFIHYGLMVGCDYNSIHGVGKKTALQILGVASSMDVDAVLASIKSELGEDADRDQEYRRAFSCFTSAQAYDIETKRNVTLDGATMTPMLESVVGSMGDDHELQQAWALGAIHPDGTNFLDSEAVSASPHDKEEFPEITTIIRRCHKVPTSLTFDMVEHADFYKDFPMLKGHIEDNDDWTGKGATKEKMISFLKTRQGRSEGTSTMLIGPLRDAVKRVLRQERDHPNEPVRLRDPAGTCLYRYLLAKKMVDKTEFPQHDDGMKPTSVSIVKTLEEYDPMCLNVSLGQVRAYNKDLGAVGNIEVKPMIRAHKNVEAYGWFSGFEYQPPDSNGNAWMGMLVPASYSMHSYKSWVCFNCSPQEPGSSANKQQECTEIVKGICPCVNGASGHCHHVNTVALVAVKLASFKTKTSSLCKWTKPGEGPMYPTKTPVSKIPIKQYDITRPSVAWVISSARGDGGRYETTWSK
jgi:hypothetical protein